MSAFSDSCTEDIHVSLNTNIFQFPTIQNMHYVSNFSTKNCRLIFLCIIFHLPFPCPFVYPVFGFLKSLCIFSCFTFYVTSKLGYIGLNPLNVIIISIVNTCFPILFTPQCLIYVCPELYLLLFFISMCSLCFSGACSSQLLESR